MNPVNVLEGKTLALCEDEGVTVLQMQRVLEREGVRVVAISGDGRESVDAVLRERPDIVIMDINLPNMDGIEATRRILRTYRSYQPCIVLVTAYSDEEHRKAAMEAGASGYIVKPLTGTMLLSELRAAIEDCNKEVLARTQQEMP